MNKAIFLDRDGTIVKGVAGEKDSPGYLLKPEQVVLIEGAADAVALGRKLGYKIIVITNQSAIARGWLTEETLSEINEKIFRLLRDENSDAVIDGLYFSPYHTDGVIDEYTQENEMRKPGIGMINQAQMDFSLELTGSYIIGDALSDIQCGVAAGTKNILVRTGYGASAYKKCLDENIKIDFIAGDILEAVRWIESKKIEINKH